MNHRTTFTCLFLLLAVDGDQEPYNRDDDKSPTSTIRGAYNKAHCGLTQADTLKTYIVVYKQTDATTLERAKTVTNSIVDSIAGAEVIFRYDTVLQGAAVKLTASAAEQLKNNDAIDYVVEDMPVSPSLGLDCIEQRDLP